jgi:hypothetical protein
MRAASKSKIGMMLYCDKLAFQNFCIHPHSKSWSNIDIDE